MRPVSSAVLAAGSWRRSSRPGYAPAAGVFGIHRYHHVAEDDERCLNAPATVAAAEGSARCSRPSPPDHPGRAAHDVARRHALVVSQAFAVSVSPTGAGVFDWHPGIFPELTTFAGRAFRCPEDVAASIAGVALERAYRSGAVIIRQDDVCAETYLLTLGQARAAAVGRSGASVLLYDVAPGDLFGALVQPGSRSEAEVTAVKAARTAVFEPSTS